MINWFKKISGSNVSYGIIVLRILTMKKKCSSNRGRRFKPEEEKGLWIPSGSRLSGEYGSHIGQEFDLRHSP